ncbi:nuclear RNA export factor 1/2 [Trypanosoma theileri]|uniref:Nuclear RNA export factor 1/2 n=1 Tax=Trypanosoma theileri TaxID=67003 RepID=A0A1X0P4L1_9TRYP|nr:nuclear RNA export factor 1/2 [Trypanosoma theileri]ORC91771.1 nuclear RNA export factor 1/2 [Trypanosoma theileri]
MSAPYKKTKDKSRVPCVFFRRGTCTNQNCPYLHVGGKGSDGKSGILHSGSSGNGSSETATNLLSTMLKLVFEKQQHHVYNAATEMLDLTEFSKLPDLKDVASSINFNTQSFCHALCTTIKSLIIPPPSILQLKKNGITTLHPLATQLEKADLHLSLRAISFEDNQINSLDVLSDLKSFRNLQEIVFLGNPITENKNYRAQVRRVLPFLLGLDGESIVAPPLSLPWPQFVDAGYNDAQRHVLQFIQCSLLNPLESDGTPEVPRGVDVVSSVYAPNAVLSISLSSPESAVSSPARKMESGTQQLNQQRNIIREIVGLRLKQTECNHNLLHGVKSNVMACGRTKVCSQLEHWLYPKCFNVQHFLHGSASASFLDNTYLYGASPVAMKVPVTVVTLHGVMIWTYRSQQNNSNNDLPSIRRNFSRVLTVSQSEAGRWLITNDMVSLYPFTGLSGDSQKKGSVSNGDSINTDLSESRILFSPRTDRSRVELLSRRHNVPPDVVMALCQHVNNDAELITVLNDIRGVPLSMFEHCAELTDSNVLESIQVCRIGNRFGLAPQEGLALLRQVNGNWCAVEEAILAANSAQQS